MNDQNKENLGLGLLPGNQHYRAFVGPPEDYDLVAAMTFNLVTTLGLRQHHKVLDIGCGSLRVGRLLIPYLNVGKYTGIDPNHWLIDEGIQREVGFDMVRIKQPRFYASDSTSPLSTEDRYDFALAQSIFSHCGPDLVQSWLRDVSAHLMEKGALVATFLIAEQDCQTNGWVYPGCVYYTLDTMRIFAQEAGLRFLPLEWKHPRQTWALFMKPGFDTSWFEGRTLSWNTYLEFGPKP